MHKRLLPLMLMLTIGAAPAVTACEGGYANNPSGSNPPILDDQHDGWSWTHCDGCHDLPVSNHTEDRQDFCANCHGGNGALDPNHLASPKIHSPAEDCVGCHINDHGYTASSECRHCHFADEGVDPG